MLGLQGARFARFKAVFAVEVESCCDYGVIALRLQWNGFVVGGAKTIQAAR